MLYIPLPLQLYCFLFIDIAYQCCTSCRYVSSELATDAIINVGEVKFYLHKVWSPCYTFTSSELDIYILDWLNCFVALFILNWSSFGDNI